MRVKRIPRIEEIPLERILAASPDDEPYVFTYRPDTADLHASIETSGLLVPPVLREDGAGQIRVICGSLRIKVLRQLGRESVQALVVSASEWTDAECISRSVLENRWHRGFNEVEKAMVFTRLKDRFPHLLPDLAHVLVKDLTMPQNPEALDSSRFVLSLPKPILDGLASGSLSLGQALLLRGVPVEERLPLSRVMTECGLTFQESREALEWILDISGREKKGPSEILDDRHVRSILAGPGGPRQKAQPLLSVLRNRRYPLLESWKERFASARSQLGSEDKGIRVSHDPTFETSEIRLQISARSEAELSERLEILSCSLQEGKIRRLFQALSVQPEQEQKKG
jgi:ParB-like chromosome segregation protein Spo0J